MNLKHRLKLLLLEYADVEGTTFLSGIRDALTDLHHLCDENTKLVSGKCGLNLETVWQFTCAAAEEEYQEEI